MALSGYQICQCIETVLPASRIVRNECLSFKLPSHSIVFFSLTKIIQLSCFSLKYHREWDGSFYTLAWLAMWCLDICLNIISGISVKGNVVELNICISRLSKADCPPKGGWTSSHQFKIWKEQKDRAGENVLMCDAINLGP